MLVSWNWLKEYLSLDLHVDDVARRLMLAGLNHESTTAVGGDWCVDLEVTSNRPDCLGHIGVAREIAVLFGGELKIPPARPAESATAIGEQLQGISVECPELCPRYTARLIRGVKIGPSPKWLVERLATIGIAAINNVVDVTNYVLMECGQPLHAFDFVKVGGRRIIVRPAKKGEHFTAINHKAYELEPGMCVIADANRPMALGGVMGGAETEVGLATRDVLLESAQFDSMSIRATARKLNLHSPSSYRFERGLDPQGVDWASRRACELILQTAGGELASGAIDVGGQPAARQPVTLRLAQLKRILGIEIPATEVRRILAALGNQETAADATVVDVVPPSWRRDLNREIDLVEEVARIHGYDKIPEDVSVPMAPSTRTPQDRVLAKVRQVLVAGGFSEALTLSVVDEAWSTAFSPWTDAAPLKTLMPIMRRAEYLRRSLTPSLLGVRQTNEAAANPRAELFEIAKVYLAQPQGLPREEIVIALASGDDYFAVKGALESLVQAINPAADLQLAKTQQPLLDAVRCCELRLNDQTWGFLGELTPAALKSFDLRASATVAEVKLSTLMEIAQLIPQARELSAYPAVSRDLNFVVVEATQWADLAACVRGSGGQLLEHVQYKDTYRDADRLGPGKKSLLLTMQLRRTDGTLTSDEADRVRDQVVAACQQSLGAELRA